VLLNLFVGGLQGCYLSLDHLEEDGFEMCYLDDSVYKEPYNNLARVYIKNSYITYMAHIGDPHM